MQWYRLLSKMFPRPFRSDYEQELETAAADMLRAERDRGRGHRLRLRVGLMADAGATLAAERNRREWTVWVLLALFGIACVEAAWAWFCGKAW